MTALPEQYFIRAIERDGKKVDFRYWDGKSWRPLSVRRGLNEQDLFFWETPMDWCRGGEIEEASDAR